MKKELLLHICAEEALAAREFAIFLIFTKHGPNTVVSAGPEPPYIINQLVLIRILLITKF
jgi:hypothetical protein